VDLSQRRKAHAMYLYHIKRRGAGSSPGGLAGSADVGARAGVSRSRRKGRLRPWRARAAGTQRRSYELDEGVSVRGSEEVAEERRNQSHLLF
ncbi:hypothetical protein H0H87_010963, partial [Tephrocybe sp. NHM501043]